MKQLQVVFVSKPFDLKELLYWQGALIRPECVEIAEIIRLSPGAYDELVSDFTRRRAWLRGKGGAEWLSVSAGAGAALSGHRSAGV